MTCSICFDLGGVIVADFNEPMMVLASSLFGLPAERIKARMDVHKVALQTGKIDHVEYWNRIASDLDVEPPEGVERLLVEPWLEHATVDGEMLALVRELNKRYVVGCLSNTQEPHVTFLRERGVLNRFDPVILSCEEGVRKPDPRIYGIYCERAGVDPTEVLYVDDREEHVQGARAIGMHGVLFAGIDSVREAIDRFER